MSSNAAEWLRITPAGLKAADANAVTQIPDSIELIQPPKAELDAFVLGSAPRNLRLFRAELDCRAKKRRSWISVFVMSFSMWILSNTNSPEIAECLTDQCPVIVTLTVSVPAFRSAAYRW